MSWQRGGVRRSCRRGSSPCRSSGCGPAVPCLLLVATVLWQGAASGDVFFSLALASSLDTVVVVLAALSVFDGARESEDPQAKPRSAF